MPNRPTRIRWANEVPEYPHRYPQSSEPMGPVRRQDMPEPYWWSDAPSRELGPHDGLPEVQRTRAT